ncbi:MAG TPA: zinc-binding dehydrogenase [Anaerolineae bacterium]|nr:zinc-binding dehydrogenase [Anaerolineae bacterium]
MKALYFTEHGGPEVLRYGDLPDPIPGPGQVRVRVKAVALNHLDLWVRRGGPAFAQLPRPHIGGCDVSGIVEAYGAGVSAPPLGARVAIDPGLTTLDDEWTRRGEDSVSPGYLILGEHTTGGAAELIVVPARNLLPLPDDVSHEIAAAASLAALTAWRMLVHRAQLKRGESIAIVGAGGGVNHLALQIAKHVSATVFAITSSAEKMEQVRALGADHAINYKDEDWSKAVFLATGKRGVDVVVDNVGQATWHQSIRALARGGRLVTVGNTSGYQAATDVRFVWSKQISILGSTMGSHQDYRDVMQLVFHGQIRPAIHTVLPLSEGRIAHEVLERGEQFGKVVLRP